MEFYRFHNEITGTPAHRIRNKNLWRRTAAKFNNVHQRHVGSPLSQYENREFLLIITNIRLDKIGDWWSVMWLVIGWLVIGDWMIGDWWYGDPYHLRYEHMLACSSPATFSKTSFRSVAACLHNGYNINVAIVQHIISCYECNVQRYRLQSALILIETVFVSIETDCNFIISFVMHRTHQISDAPTSES